MEVPERWVSLLRQIILPVVFPGVRTYLVRSSVLMIALPVFAILQFVNVLALLLDEILFYRYGKVVLARPVFILGVPRSGTTHTHHLLANDARFSTVTLWECLFAPSITQRHVLTNMARLDARLGAPGERLLSWFEQRLQSLLNDVHPTGLFSPEEDFLLLLPTLDCFLLVLVFPECPWLWRLSQGDCASHGTQAARLMKRYRRLLQRHVYFHGEHLQLLSKNASFSGLAHSLAEEFPDALLVVCERDAELAVRSQLRSLQDIRNASSIDRVFPAFEVHLLNTLQFYYENLQALQKKIPDSRWVSVPLWRLSRHPRSTVQLIYRQLELGSVASLDVALTALESAPATRPATPCAGHDRTTPHNNKLFRFAHWRHAPENRL